MDMFSGGTGTQADPYLIATAEDLNDVRNYLFSHFLQIADIDLSVYENWEPIGNANNPFTGGYNGNNHIITNLTINRPAQDYIGLFGDVIHNYIGIYTPIGERFIGNIILSNIDIKGNRYCGGLIGRYAVYTGAAGSVIDIFCCIMSNGSIHGERYVGGLIGRYWQSGSVTIQNCGSSIIVSGEDYVGGLIGSIGENVVVSKCYSDGNVFGNKGVGGLIGLIESGSSANNYYEISDCYNYSELSGYNQVGGLIGFVNNYGDAHVGNILRNYSIGNIVCDRLRGGFIAYVTNLANINIEYCYHNSNTEDNYTVYKTTSEMKQQQSFENWNFDSIWGISPNINNGYPYLLWSAEPLSGLKVFAITDTGLKQAKKICIITDAGLKEIKKLNVITDDGLK